MIKKIIQNNFHKAVLVTGCLFVFAHLRSRTVDPAVLWSDGLDGASIRGNVVAYRARGAGVDGLSSDPCLRSSA